MSNTERTEQDHDGVGNLLCGRRGFDRQLDMLSIAVHTLQRDFAALEERVRGMQDSATALSASIHLIEDEMHKLDK